MTRFTMYLRRVRDRLLAGAVLLSVSVGCAGGYEPSIKQTPSVAERSFAMGLVPMPREWSDDEIADAYRLTAEAGEVVSLSEHLGWTTDAYIDKYAEGVAHARRHGLKTMISLDLLDASRSEIANLPKELRGRGLEDAELRQRFVAEATEIASRYHPDYLMLAIEINGLHRADPDGFHDFVTLYTSACDSIKLVSPASKIAVTFQYELLVGRVQWDLVSMFGDRLELLCVTTYPGETYGSLEAVPPDYYAVLKEVTSTPVVFSEIGWRGSSRAEGERIQGEFITRFFELTDGVNLHLAIWCLLHDWEGGGVFETMGLIDRSGRKKPAWEVWKDVCDRPLRAFEGSR